MSMQLLKRLIACALLATAAACAPRSRGEPISQIPRTVLVVDNQAFVDMRMFALNGSQRMRLGLATSKTVTAMTIPGSIITGARVLNFMAEPMASNRSAVSEALYVNPGDTVRLMIPPT